MLLDVEALGLSAPDLSRAPVDQKAAATDMTRFHQRAWSEHESGRESGDPRDEPGWRTFDRAASR
jgi:hypothetical protein